MAVAEVGALKEGLITSVDGFMLTPPKMQIVCQVNDVLDVAFAFRAEAWVNFMPGNCNPGDLRACQFPLKCQGRRLQLSIFGFEVSAFFLVTSITSPIRKQP